MTRHARPRDDTGGVTVEVVLLAPVVLALLCLLVGFGRVQTTRGELTGAARDAARAASLTRDPAAATAAARAAVTATLTGAEVPCREVTVTTDTSRFAPGGRVTVHVACTSRLGDLALAGLPGLVRLTATGAAPLDTYRQVHP